MEIRRFFTTPENIQDGFVTLDGDEFLHMTKVLRYKVGYKAIVCANDGKERLCTITDINNGCATLKIDEEKAVDEKHTRVTLFAGLLKNNKLDFAIQKSVELGVDKIVPFVSQNSAEDKFSVERANRIALEGAKQCGSVYLTEIGNLISFEDVLDSMQDFDIVLFAYEDEKHNRIKDFKVRCKNVAVVVGCEGGFTADEAAKARDKGANIVTLGKRILRAETASIVASTLLLDSAGELDYD